MERYLKDVFGLDRILWITSGYLAGDDTDSHVDTLARFCSEDTIAYVRCEDEEDEHYEELKAMEEEIDDNAVDYDEDDYTDIAPVIKKYMRPGDDDNVRRALEVVVLDRKASTSYLQRRLKIGYNRAAEIMDLFEERGIVGAASGSGNKREILIFDGMDEE